jgi:simple sugar transport system substrate-binding protein
MFFSLSACGVKEPEPAIADRIVLGFSQVGDESEWRSSSTNDIKNAAERAGIQLVFENALQKRDNQIKALRSFILNGVDVIAFSPIVEEGWDNVLGEAKDAGIPVILIDRYIKTEKDDLYCAFIGSDFFLEGVRAAEWMVARFARQPGPIRVAEISGTEFSSPTIGRYEGLRTVFGENPKFVVVASVSGDFMRSKGIECMETILDKTDSIDILYAHNDDMAIGAIEVLEERGIAPGRDIAIVSVDAQRSGLAALKEGKINCIVECNPYVGDELMELVKNIVNKAPYLSHTYVEEKVYTDMDDSDSLPVRP